MRKRDRCFAPSGGVSRVEQSHKDGCNIKRIVARYNKTGLLEQRLQKGIYGDFSNVSDYRTCVDRVRDAAGDFAALPSDVRKRFRNDPGVLIDFLSDPDNLAEAMELGVIPKLPEGALPGLPKPPSVDKAEKASDEPARAADTA